MDKGLEAAYLIAERRSEHRKKQLREAKADAWDEAMKAASGVVYSTPNYTMGVDELGKYKPGSPYDRGRYDAMTAIRNLVNPYRSKTNG